MNESNKNVESLLSEVVAKLKCYTLTRDQKLLYRDRLLEAQRYVTVEDCFSMKDILMMVCSYFKVPPQKVVSRCQKREHVRARHFTMYFTFRVIGLTYESIGDFFSGKDHTTVINAKNQVLIQLASRDENLFKRYHKELCGILGISYEEDLSIAMYEGGFIKLTKSPSGYFRPHGKVVRKPKVVQLEDKVRAFAI